MPGDAHLAAEPLQQARIEGCRFRQELQRDLLFQFQVMSALDLAHAAVAEESENAIAFSKDDADRKAAVAGRCQVRLKAPAFARSASARPRRSLSGGVDTTVGAGR